MVETGDRIGGDASGPKYALIYAVGVAVGSVIRAGMWLLPTGFVDGVTSRLERE